MVLPPLQTPHSTKSPSTRSATAYLHAIMVANMRSFDVMLSSLFLTKANSAFSLSPNSTGRAEESFLLDRVIS